MPSYQPARHTVALCEALEALEAREIRRLIVTMPPRHGKTLHASQALPAWYLGRRPSESVILASYAAELAESNSRRARGFVTDPRFPFATNVAADSSAVNRWATSAGGGLIAAGVGGGITGFGAHLLIVDDPVKGREEADSAAIRESTWRWWSEVALTRLQPGAVVLIAATRWHQDDLVGRVLNSSGADEWKLLSLPALADDDDALGRYEGEALWPGWFDEEHLNRLRSEIGERAFSALYQGSPTSERGGVFRREWLAGRYAEPPRGPFRIVQAVDSAFKTYCGSLSVMGRQPVDALALHLAGRKRVDEPLGALAAHTAAFGVPTPTGSAAWGCPLERAVLVFSLNPAVVQLNIHFERRPNRQVSTEPRPHPVCHEGCGVLHCLELHCASTCAGSRTGRRQFAHSMRGPACVTLRGYGSASASRYATDRGLEAPSRLTL